MDEEFKILYTASEVQREINKKAFLEKKAGGLAVLDEAKPIVTRTVESSTFKTSYTITVIEKGITTTYQKIEYFMFSTAYFKNSEEIEEQVFKELTQNL